MGEDLSFAFIVRASPLASCRIHERGRSHYNKKMLFAKQRCSRKGFELSLLFVTYFYLLGRFY